MRVPHLDGSAQVDGPDRRPGNYPDPGSAVPPRERRREGGGEGRRARALLRIGQGCWLSGILVIIVISARFVAQAPSGNILRVASPVPGLSLPAQINT